MFSSGHHLTTSPVVDIAYMVTKKKNVKHNSTFYFHFSNSCKVETVADNLVLELLSKSHQKVRIMYIYCGRWT